MIGLIVRGLDNLSEILNLNFVAVNVKKKKKKKIVD